MSIPSSIIGVIWDAAKILCGCIKREADFVFDLEKNLQSLKDENRKLEDTKKDVQLQIQEAQKNPEIKVSQQVTGWLHRVERIQQEIEDVEAQRAPEIQNKCASKWCSRNCMSSNKLGKDVSEKLKDVDKLITEGKSFFGKEFIVVHNVPPNAIEMPPDDTVGLDFMFNKVWKSMEEKNVGVIGLYGMGGVGKTTLLKKINNELAKTRLGFHSVMWVVVSKEPNLDSIMDNIRKLIRIGDDIWHQCCNRDEKAAKIYGVLKQKKFVLLLDDIWERIDLNLVGVPHPKDTDFKSKVLFTTRVEDVCEKMQAQMKFKVQILSDKEALELFCMKVGEDTLNSHQNIPKLADKMAKECKGLPLALIVVGSAMAGVKSVDVWEHSINNLTSSSQTGPDLETNVFPILKFSYDKLNEVQKRCFLYCALYPEDCDILVSDLINKWMWEKFLCKDMIKSVQDMHGYGESIIEKLKLSCLLETVEDDLFMNRTIKMHDVIRDMALWLIPQDGNNMGLVKRISIVNDWESQKIQDPPNVTTLVLVKKHFRYHIRRQLEDIKYMKRLKVLELNVDSGQAFGDIGDLISLEYLSVCMIEETLGPEFWTNLQSLTNLKFLSCATYSFLYDCDIPSGVISSLQRLRVFRLTGIGLIDSEERRMLEELEGLPIIEELRIVIRSEDGVNKLMESTKLQSCICNLSIIADYLEEMSSLSLGSMLRMKQLQEIDFYQLNIISNQYSSVFGTCRLTNLRKVKLWSCPVTHATWLKYASYLQELEIRSCDSMEQVIKEDENNIVDSSSPVFSSLVNLFLKDLPRLESIHKAPLSFPYLKSIQIYGCSDLKKLPLDFNSAKYNKLTLISGQQDWWDNLKWDHLEAKLKFQSNFKVL